ncbi:transposase [Geminicoccus harenae]|uniref:transposase n=1 Tax=Geminicoccus harenae TaxID=2498453 RepID=UPI00168BF4CD
MPRRKPPRRQAHDTDLTDGQWKLIAPLVSEPRPGRRPRKVCSRERVNAILHFLRAGVASRLLPTCRPGRRWS